MDFFGQQVGRERNQQVDQHRRTRLLAEAAPQPTLERGHAEGNRHAHGQAATATHRKVSEAVASEKEPVITAATAKRKQTRPEASLSSDSPSRMCIRRLGIGAFEAIAPTATGSVGETMAASAKHTASGITGIIQWISEWHRSR